ncbi:hypothetical protein BC828DRAFT_197050 [Blastocladiella britannica]|nr:hypothetical protein BC828DRAFT_197050 [Blastocladiella britannica]
MRYTVDREQAMVVVPAMDDTQRFDVFLLRTPASNDGSGPVRFTAIARNVGVATWSDKPVGQLLGLEWFLPHSARASSMVTPSVMAIYESGTCVVYSWDTPPNKSGSSEPGATVPPKCPPQPRFGVSLETDPLLACTVDAKGKVGVVGTVTGSAWMFELEPANHDAIVTQQIWGPINAATAANETSDEAEPRPISSVAVSPDNKRIALACHDGSIQLVKRSTGAPVARLDPPAGGGGGSAKIRRVKWSGSGPLTLAAAYDDGTIALWTLP